MEDNWATFGRQQRGSLTRSITSFFHRRRKVVLVQCLCQQWGRGGREGLGDSECPSFCEPDPSSGQHCSCVQSPGNSGHKVPQGMQRQLERQVCWWSVVTTPILCGMRFLGGGEREGGKLCRGQNWVGRVAQGQFRPGRRASPSPLSRA